MATMKCKYCQSKAVCLRDLVTHYKTDHFSNQRNPSWPCIVENCSFNFTTYSALTCHLSRYHKNTGANTKVSRVILCCERCSEKFSELHGYLKHLRDHITQHETVLCPFLDCIAPGSDCSFSSNVASTFRSHLSRSHFNATVSNIRSSLTTSTVSENCVDDVVGHYPLPNAPCEALDVDDLDDLDDSLCISMQDDSEYENKVLRFMSMVFVRMQCVLNLPITAIQRVIDDIHDIKALSRPLIFQKLRTSFPDSIISEEQLQRLCDDLQNDDPLIKSTVRDGLLGTHKKRLLHAKTTLPYVAPKQFVLGCVDGTKRTFVYVSVIEMLQALMTRVDVLNAVMQTRTSKPGIYKNYSDGSICKSNPLYNENECYIRLLLYCDEWESANPLGTNRKKHKILAFYWSLANIDTKFRSTLHIIQLAILCKSSDIRHFGYGPVLKPLLRDLVLLENDGIFIEKLGMCMKGTLVFVVADNLGAYSIGGFIESFSGPGHICRYCMFPGSHLVPSAASADSANHTVRNRSNYARHVQQVRADMTTVKKHGIKRNSELHSDLQFFHVTSGLPFDVYHDLAEGIVPYELAIGIQYFIKVKYFSEPYLRLRLNTIQLKSSDKMSRPVLSASYAKSRTVGGNMSKNWTFIRLLPMLIGHKVKEGDDVWNMLMELKDIFELAVAPTHTEETIALLQMKINDHKKLFRLCFPQLKMKPKHHYLEHYPSQIKQYGSLVGCSTIRFEAKHNYFKQIVNKAKNFKNILLTLSERHQLMQACFLSSVQYLKSEAEFTGPKEIVMQTLEPEMRLALEELSASGISVCFAEKCTVFGTKYFRGLFVASEIVGCLPSFGQILEICAVSGEAYFVLRQYTVSYDEKFHCFNLMEMQEKLKCCHVNSLIDYYPLPAYHFQQQWFIFPKHFVALQ